MVEVALGRGANCHCVPMNGQPSVDSVYLDLVGGKLEMVWSDTSHPLYGQLRSQLIPRGSGRLGLPYAGTNRHPASFIPKAIKMFNDNVGR